MTRGARAFVAVLVLFLLVSVVGNAVLLKRGGSCGVVSAGRIEVSGGAVADEAYLPGEALTEQKADEEAPAVVAPTSAPVPAPTPTPAPVEVPALVEVPFLISSASMNSSSWLVIRFTKPSPVPLGRENVSIEPAVGNLDVYCYGSVMNVEGDFEPGVAYAVTVSASGEKLTAIVVPPDRPSRVRFSSSGRLFPLSNKYWNLPVQAENIDGKLKVDVREVYPSLLLQFLGNQDASQNTHLVASSELPVRKLRNKRQKLSLELSEVGIERRPGVYRIGLYDSEHSWNSSSETVIVTDLGVSATVSPEAVAVSVRSLRDNGAVAGAEVSVYTRKIQLAGKGETGDDGCVVVPFKLLDDKEDGLAYLVVRKGDDISYCTVMGVEKSPVHEKAALFFERGVMRPGESVRCYASLRDESLTAKGGVPAQFTLRNSLGDDIAQKTVVGDALGVYEVEWSLPKSCPTGMYSVRMSIPGDGGFVYGSGEVLVSEYVPDQLKASLEAEVSQDGGRLVLGGDVRYYFGAPLKDGRIDISLAAMPVPFSPKGYEGFTFGPSVEDNGTVYLMDRVRSDAAGRYSGTLEIPGSVRASGLPVNFCVEATCNSPVGGRPVTSRVEVLRHYQEGYLGGYKDDGDSSRCAVKLVWLTADGKERAFDASRLTYKLNRLSWEYLLKTRTDGRMERIWECVESAVRSAPVTLSDDGWLFLPEGIGRGRFKLLVYEGETQRLQMEFWHWGGESGSRLKDPRSLDFELDKESYLPGDRAVVSFESPVAGAGVVVSGLSGISGQSSFPVVVGRNTFELSIPPELSYGRWFATVSVASREDDASDPIHLSGEVELKVKQDVHRMKVAIDMASEGRPGSDQKIRVALSTHDGKPVPGKVVVWGMQAGVLSLTGYKTPDLFEHFFGRVYSPFSAYDNYWMFYPVLNAGTEKIGGDFRMMDAMKAAYAGGITENREAPAAFTLGIVDVDDSGVAELTARLPEHTGMLRVMAVALDKERTGSAEAEVVLRREVTVVAHTPRVVAPGDDFQVGMEFFGKAEFAGKEAQWSVECDGGDIQGAASGSVAFIEGQAGCSASAKTLVHAGSPDSGHLALTIRLKSGEFEAIERADVVVRPALPSVETQVSMTLAPGGQGDFAVGRFGSIEAGTPALAIAGSLKWLSEYPYGCLEQVTSAAFPLLSVPRLVSAGILPEAYGESARQRVELAILDLASRRRSSSDAMLSMWPGGSTYWLDGSVFAYLFLFEAERCGFKIQDSFRSAIARELRQNLNKTDLPAESRSMMLLVLAYVEPKMVPAYARLLDDSKCDGFTRLLKYMAFVKAGYPLEVSRELDSLLKTDFLADHSVLAGFDSIARRMGMSLWLIGETLPTHPAIQRIQEGLLALRNSEGHWGTTQDNAWAAMGLAAVIPPSAGEELSFEMMKDGGERSVFSNQSIRVEGPVSLHLVNKGDAPVTVMSRDRAVPAEAVAASNGIQVRREYLGLDGKPVKEFRQGDLLQVAIRIAITSGEVGDFVVCDLLPGCFEIEDELLMTRARNISPSEQERLSIFLSRMEKLYDRFLGFGNSHWLDIGKEYSVIYKVRVVSPGEYTVPPVSVESMYHPELRALQPAPEPRILVK